MVRMLAEKYKAEKQKLFANSINKYQAHAGKNRDNKADLVAAVETLSGHDFSRLPLDASGKVHCLRKC